MNSSYIKGILIIDLGIVLSILLIILCYRPIRSIFHLLNALIWTTFLNLDVDAKLGIIGFLVVIFTGWGVYRLERRHNKKRSLETLHIAIDDFENATQVGGIREGEGIKIRNVYFDTTVYEAIIHSGLFTFFPKNLQIPITKLYTRIQLHNEYFKYRIKLMHTFSMYGSTNATQQYHNIGHQIELYLTLLNTEMEGLVKLIRTELTKKW